MSESFSKISFASIASICAGGAGGWVMTSNLAGNDAAQSFFYIFITIVLVLPALQAALWRAGRKRLIFQIACRLTLLFTIIWFLSSLILPVFWMPNVLIEAKYAIAGSFVIISLWNVRFGFFNFKSKWSKFGRKIFDQSYKNDASMVDWSELLKSLKLSSAHIIPGIPEQLNAVITVAILVFMVLGLNLRNSFPVFSIFAWGLPATILAAYCMYPIGIGIAEIAKVRELEISKKTLIAPVNR